jgi:molybdopterin-binding protein
MRVSARNQIKGTIKEVKKGTTTAHVLVDIGDRYWRPTNHVIPH